MMNNLFFPLVIGIIFAAGCISTAKIGHLPDSSDLIDFDSLSDRNMDLDSSSRNHEGISEYMVYITGMEDRTLVELLKQANQNQGFTNKRVDIGKRRILGSRGMRMNEWNSVSGIYYRKTDDNYQVYVRVDITQDVTGGRKENRAKKIAEEICQLAEDCDYRK